MMLASLVLHGTRHPARGLLVLRTPEPSAPRPHFQRHRHILGSSACYLQLTIPYSPPQTLTRRSV